MFEKKIIHPVVVRPIRNRHYMFVDSFEIPNYFPFCYRAHVMALARCECHLGDAETGNRFARGNVIKIARRRDKLKF